MLEKDPIKRITWNELRKHPFWSAQQPFVSFKKGIVYPEQPQFDQYLTQRGIVPQHFYESRNNPLAQKFINAHSSQSSTKVDILRLSTVAKKNLTKEQEENVSE